MTGSLNRGIRRAALKERTRADIGIEDEDDGDGDEQSEDDSNEDDDEDVDDDSDDDDYGAGDEDQENNMDYSNLREEWSQNNLQEMVDGSAGNISMD